MKIMRQIQGDYLTPVSIFLRIQEEKKFLLESNPRENEEGARYSIIAIRPVKELRYQEGQFSVNGSSFPCTDPLKELEQHIIHEEVSIPTIPFQGGAIGYVGYDIAACYEGIGKLPEDELNVPDIYFYVFELFVVYDHQTETVSIIHSNAYSHQTEEEMLVTIEKIIRDLQQASKKELIEKKAVQLSYTSNVSQIEFEARVRQAKELIEVGDLFQIVLSQRLKAEFAMDAFDYYRYLRISNPSSYMYYLNFGDMQVVGCSPESLVSVKNGIVSTNPIAGTRRRGATVEEDAELANELLADEKERAEHMMLIDLGRNDIGQIAERGTVRLPIYMTIEKYRYVMHIVSLVTGKLKAELTPMDALRATLPAGTVSGAPKIRAMTRIYELEQTKRGIYAGAVGYYSMDNQADFAIAIRTMVIKDQYAYIQAGAGIVADSDPKSEYLETLQKAKALLEVGK
uniref:anthranilate synthase component I n=1 Tax=Candidatus Enterococcus willemsii TaxID=1857215 RepID=UPI00403F6FDC